MRRGHQQEGSGKRCRTNGMRRRRHMRSYSGPVAQGRERRQPDKRRWGLLFAA